MADPAPAAPPAAPAPNIPAADGAGPWHSGVDAETLGIWNNKGWSVDNPKDLAVNLTKSYSQLERHFGAPPDQILRMPKADAKPEDIKAFWQRLGAPANANEYDFSAVKFNGADLEEGFVSSMRDALAQAYVPKDKAASIAAAVVKYLENADTSEKTLTASKLADQKAALARNWGPNFDFNHLKAMEGARRAGVTPETVKAMEAGMGYDGVMEHFRRIGAGTSEEMWAGTGAKGGVNVNGMPVTRDGAQARLNELMSDATWRDRLNGGNVEARNEWFALCQAVSEE
jgi:hypothetical protein